MNTMPEELKGWPLRCQRCGKALKPGEHVWLELNTFTLEYHKPGDVLPEESQGLFPFGKRCAKLAVAQERPLYGIHLDGREDESG